MHRAALHVNACTHAQTAPQQASPVKTNASTCAAMYDEQRHTVMQVYTSMQVKRAVDHP
jgi:hypothetical protein